MKDSKINMNKPKLTQQEISNAKNFDAVIDKINGGGDDPKPEKNPKPKKNYLKVIIGTLVAAAVAWIMFKPSDKTDEDPAKTEATNKTLSLNNPPIQNLDIAMDIYTIDAANGGSITTPTGTEIVIPSNAFKKEDGTLATGPVEVSFREFHDVPSIFAAGINMQYDSAGNNYHFESAGMFEIDAKQKGNKLIANSDNPITVLLASNQPGANFNLYFQDEKDGWQFITKDTAKALPSSISMENTMLSDTIVAALKELSKEVDKAKKKYEKAIKKAGLIIPQQANDELYSMNLDFNPSQFPELDGYANVLFEINENNENFAPELANHEWNDIQLSKKSKTEYLMTLYGKETVAFYVTPVFAKKDIKNAESNFENLFNTYNLANGNKLSKEREEYQEKYNNYKETEDEVYMSIENSMIANGNTSMLMERKGKVTRVFQIGSFGMYNSDCPQKLPKGQAVEPVFVNAKDIEDTLNFNTLYIAEYNTNAMYTLYGEWGNKNLLGESGKEMRLFENPLFSFNPKSETVLWCVTNKGTLAVIKPNELKKVTFNDGNTTLKMEVIKGIGDVAHIKKSLGWK